MSTQNPNGKWLKTSVKAFLITIGLLTVTVAATAAVPPVREAPKAAASAWVPPMHEAQSGLDVGPGSDEGLLVSSP